MLGYIRKTILNLKQAGIKKRYPQVNIILHADMPTPSMNKMAQVAGIVDAINSLEPKISALTDLELKQKTDYFREYIVKKNPEFSSELASLEEQALAIAIPEEKEKVREKIKLTRNKIFAGILPEAFAVVREASRRTIGLRHFDVQLAGGIILHEGKIAEMATGEGKTLVATLPAYLNALAGKGVHVVTVNDYLARRDREWMGPVYEFLGLSVGVIQHDMSDQERKLGYSCDITYGTNNEFGFDYLRDNMKYAMDELVQRPFYYAIVDEVDSILIDEARTPLIISGPAEESTEKYYTFDRLVPRLKGKTILAKDEVEAKYKGEDISKGFDYLVNEKEHTAYLTEEGEARVCSLLACAEIDLDSRTHIIQALKAHKLFKRDVDYVVKEGEVLIVDEFTGRLMPGRRWSDGLHQAVEAKEGLKIERENQTLATITFQNYFRMYEKLAGMTGTAFTEASEFKSIYQLDVVVIPTNRQLVRTNYSDRIYKTEKAKFNAVADEISEFYNSGRPVLVGTISIEKSERLSEILKRRGITHQVLNAKYHEMEAQIVAQAGRFKAVTIATNMAGRGTDILLGGNPEFMAKALVAQKLKPQDQGYQEEYRKILERLRRETSSEHEKVVGLGGLHVLGTERHEARRIDNQLRGRSGRQGDPGSSRFYISLEDDLMRLFGSDRLSGLMDKLGLEEDQVIENSVVSGSIEIAQRRVEQHNFEIRKQLLEYDNIMNKQREIVYTQRRQILEGASLKENVLGIIDRTVEQLLFTYSREGGIDLQGLLTAIKLKFGVELVEDSSWEGASQGQIKDIIHEALVKAYEEKERNLGSEIMRQLESMLFLQIVDTKWKEHLYNMDDLKEGIGLRAYGQRDPLVEYRREAFEMFDRMVSSIEDEAAEAIFKLQPARPERFKAVFRDLNQELLHPETAKFEASQQQDTVEQPSFPGQPEEKSHPIQASGPKVGRNDPCPCGSGKKYKKCHGR